MQLATVGQMDETTRIHGINFPYGSTGMISLCDGNFYFSRDFRVENLHGTDLPEDMTIPIIINGENFEAGKVLKNVNIKDIAPTVTKLLDAEPDDEWEGKSIL